MSFTYRGPSFSTRDQVRYLVQDTDSSDPLLSDDEVGWLLSQYADIRVAASEAAKQIALQFARKPKIVKEGTVMVDYGARSAQYMALAAQLAQRLAMPFAGGISESDKLAREQDTDRVQPTFTRDQDQYPGTWTRQWSEHDGADWW